ncbi:MAG: leucine-rich repeat domain-containing protein [Holosporales bacterium]|jgi:hypothetical protein|nr:leucine-rich repeat domain-containing protein [Holosporales bacterium]
MQLYLSKILFGESICSTHVFVKLALGVIFASAAFATGPVAQFDEYISAATTALTGTNGLSALVGNASTELSAISSKIGTINTALTSASNVVRNKTEPEPSPVLASAWYAFCDNIAAQLTSVETLFKYGPRNSAAYRAHIQSNVNALQSAIAGQQTNIRTELTMNYAQFTKYLQDENTDIATLRNKPNSLVLLRQDDMPATPTLANLEHLYLVCTYPDFDITACTSLKTIGFFDGPALSSTQRTHLSTLAKVTKQLQNLIVMNWGNTSIAGSAFSGATSLVKVIIHKVTTIGNQAFASCTNLISVSIPDATSIGSLGDYGTGSFQDCSALTTVSFPAAQIIGTCAFIKCRKLLIASFPAAVTVGRYGFHICDSLTTVQFPSAETLLGAAFAYDNLITTAYFPVVKIISGSAFQRCTGLQEITYPADADVESGAFAECLSTLKRLDP